MSVLVGIVTNPLDPSTWEEHRADDPRELLMRLFPSWPDSARIYDLEGVGDWTRAASLIDPQVLKARDVTPQDEAGVDRLGELRGPLLVTIPPADPLTAIIAVVAIAVGVAAAFLLMPKIPGAQRQPSPNNALSERTNQARPGARVPDIVGTVESTPDLLMQPYSIFENDREVEIAFMCVGRGSFAISRVRDGDTALASISGSSAAIYGPGTSPNSGDAPQLQIGAAIPEIVQSVAKLNEVNGQTLQPTNLNRVQGEDSIRFVYPDSIESNDSDIDFTDYFSDGDAISIAQADISGPSGSTTITADARYTSAGRIEFSGFDPTTIFSAGQMITVANAGYAGDTDDLGTAVLFVDLSGTYLIDSLNAGAIQLSDPAGTNSDWDRLEQYVDDRTEYRSGTFSVAIPSEGINLNGNYTILSVSSAAIILNNPALVNEAWNNLADLEDQATDYVSPSISRNSDVWVGAFVIDLDDNQEIIANIVGMNGLYTLSKKKGKQSALSVGVELEATPVNSSDAAIGPAELFPATITGSDTERTSVGYTMRVSPSFSGRCSIRMRRTTPTPDDDDFGAIADEIKWRDAYGLAPIEQTDFGDVTTVMTRTIATPGALSIKQRKLNMRVTRKLPQRLEGSTFGSIAATDSADDIIVALALDPLIGRRSIEEIDVEDVYATIAEVKEYFGSDLAGEFGYTFDSDDISFEETLATVAQAVFCTAYRQGRAIRLTFERATEDASLIFNARNTIPRSQTRTHRFGPLDDHDGVSLDYIDPQDGAQLSYSIPPDRSAKSPRSVEVVGVRSDPLAYWQAWRAWNKLRYQNISVELEATQEAALVIPNDRVLIADRTRPNILQGEVEEENGRLLRLSEPAKLSASKSWTIFLQHIDGTVEPLGVQSYSPTDPYSVQLSASPRMPLSIDAENFARATYMIVPDDDVQTRAFLINEREPQSNFTETVRAVNYSFLYYQNDELILWLAFMGANFYDSGPYLFDGIAQDGAATVMDEVRGKRVYLGSGNTDRITLPADLQAPESYTKAAWIKPTDRASPGGQNIISSSGSTAEAFFVDSGFVRAYHNAGAGVVSAALPADDAWVHVAVAYDAEEGQASIFVNGVKQAIGDLPERDPGPLIAFAFNAGGNGFVGRADDVRLWKRALSARELREVYQASRSI